MEKKRTNKGILIHYHDRKLNPSLEKQKSAQSARTLVFSEIF